MRNEDGCEDGQFEGLNNSRDLLGPRAQSPAMSAKRERLIPKNCAPHGAFAGGTPAVPTNILS